MKITCVWEHNGSDTLLYAVDLPGAYTRGEDLQTAVGKMEHEVRSYLRWAGETASNSLAVEIVQDVSCNLEVCDADSDVIFLSEQLPLCAEEYERLKWLALKSAQDFLLLYESVPDKQRSNAHFRRTFYGQAPRTAEEMYLHTKNVNTYYFGEINVDADIDGTIVDCRRRGFEALERKSDFLQNPVIEGSYGERWSTRKVLRRFIWHDRIHAKAMYRMAETVFGKEKIKNPFFF